jgi:hypothetical protein
MRPLAVPFFPEVLQNFALAAAAYCVPLVLGSWALLRASPRAAWVALLSFFGGSCVLLLHQDTYNDATFVTSFWVSLIGLWFHRASARAGAELASRTAYLTQLLIGLLFFGGFVGKLSPGYFDGSTLYRIYFAERNHFTFVWLRELLSPAQLRTAACVYSWFVLCVEGVLATVPLWSARPALIASMLGLGGLVLLNNFLLASVICAPLALVGVSLWLVLQTRAEKIVSRDVTLEMSP